MKIKICGITNVDDARLCESAGADALGFILYEGSKRYIQPADIAAITRKLSAFTNTVGVFVHVPVSEVNSIMKIAKLHTAQVITNTPEEYGEHCDYPFYCCQRVDDQFDFTKLSLHGLPNVLLDTYSTSAYGGTGKRFDWSRIPEGLRKSIILAGGITAGDLSTIVQTIMPYGIDVSSSVELSPGKKDPIKVESFFNTYKMVR